MDRCAACKGTGKILIDRCPKSILSPGIGEFCKTCDMADQGLWPIAAGSIFNTQSFLAGYDYLKSEDAHWASRRKKTE